MATLPLVARHDNVTVLNAFVLFKSVGISLWPLFIKKDAP